MSLLRRLPIRGLLVVTLCVAAALLGSLRVAHAQIDPLDPGAPQPAPSVLASAQPGLQSLSSSFQACNVSTGPVSPPSWASPITNLILDLINPVQNFTKQAYGYGRTLFLILMPLELAWFFLHVIVRRDDVHDLFRHVGFKLLSVFFFLGMLDIAGSTSFVTNFENGWIGAANTLSANSAAYSGAVNTSPTVVGAADPNSLPGRVIGAGVCSGFLVAVGPLMGVVNNLASGGVGGAVKAAANAVQIFAFGALGTPFFIAMLIFQICLGLFVAASFCIIALQLIMTLIERAIITSTGLILLGFSATRWTMDWAQSYWKYMVHIGIKLFVLTLIANIGCAWMSNLVWQQANAGGGWSPIAGIPQIFVEAFAAMLLMGMTWSMPSMVATYLSGTPAMGTATLAAGAGVPIMVGMAIAELATGLKGVTTAMQAAKAGIQGVGSQAGVAGVAHGGRTLALPSTSAGAAVSPPLTPTNANAQSRAPQQPSQKTREAEVGAAPSRQSGVEGEAPDANATTTTAPSQSDPQPEPATSGASQRTAGAAPSEWVQMMDSMMQSHAAMGEHLSLGNERLGEIARQLKSPTPKKGDVLTAAVRNAANIKRTLLSDHQVGGGVHIQTGHYNG